MSALCSHRDFTLTTTVLKKWLRNQYSVKHISDLAYKWNLWIPCEDKSKGCGTPFQLLFICVNYPWYQFQPSMFHIHELIIFALLKRQSYTTMSSVDIYDLECRRCRLNVPTQQAAGYWCRERRQLRSVTPELANEKKIIYLVRIRQILTYVSVFANFSGIVYEQALFANWLKANSI